MVIAIIELLESIKTVPAVAHHSARLGHVAELLARSQQTNLRLDYVLWSFLLAPLFSLC